MKMNDYQPKLIAVSDRAGVAPTCKRSAGWK